MDHPVSARSASATGTRTRVRSHHLLPDRHSWIDLGFTVVLAAIALSALELLVAALQAYVFAILTCIYLNDAIHPGH